MCWSLEPALPDSEPPNASTKSYSATAFFFPYSLFLETDPVLEWTIVVGLGLQ